MSESLGTLARFGERTQRQVDVAAGQEGVKISASCAHVTIVICVMAVKLTGANRVILREVCDYTDSKT